METDNIEDEIDAEVEMFVDDIIDSVVYYEEDEYASTDDEGGDMRKQSMEYKIEYCLKGKCGRLLINDPTFCERRKACKCSTKMYYEKEPATGAIIPYLRPPNPKKIYPEEIYISDEESESYSDELVMDPPTMVSPRSLLPMSTVSGSSSEMVGPQGMKPSPTNGNIDNHCLSPPRHLSPDRASPSTSTSMQ